MSRDIDPDKLNPPTTGAPDLRVSRTFPPRQVTELWAWICIEENGGEGVAACEMEIDGHKWMMMLAGADLERVQSLEPYAKLVEKKLGRPVTLRHFMGVA